MKNEFKERIEAVKAKCINLDDALHDKYYELDAKGAENNELSPLVDAMYEVREIYKAVEYDLSISERRINKLSKELINKYNLVFVKKEEPVKAVPTAIDSNTNSNTVNSEAEVSKKDNSALIAGVALGTVVAGAVGYGIGTQCKNCNEEATYENQDQSISVVVPSQVYNPRLYNDETVQIDNNPSESVEVNQAINLVLGEYGTFFDVDDNEQVQARAQYIYDNYFAKFINNLCESDRQLISVDEIANTIRVINGKTPLDTNGNKFYDTSMEDYYLNRFVDYVANIPSCDVMGTVEYVPGYLFTIDGSKMSDFIKSYDEIYKNIADARNCRDGLKLEKNVKIMAAKYWTEWFLQGMGGNILYNNATGEISYDSVIPQDANVESYEVKNPFALYDYLKAGAFYSTMYRYGSFIYEAEHNRMATVCIPACVDYSTKTLEELSIDQIYTAIDSGVWNNVIAKSAGMEAPKDPISVGFWERLRDQLEYDYNHTYQLVK